MGCTAIIKKSKRNKYKNNLNDVKSVYILRQIFDIILESKQLGIIRYNKKLQKRLDLSINNNKKYSALYSSIEIEINPTINEYGNFINIFSSDKKYYHIYFDDKKEEIKRNYLDKKDKVNKIKIKIDYQVKSLKKLFFECYCIESINFKEFYRNNIIDMSYMFYGCSLLKELNLSNFSTNNVIDMSYMLFKCLSLKELNLLKFNTINVTNMNHMFYFCSSLEELYISNFNTVNVIDMNYMFFKCSSLEELNLSNFNTINVTDMSYMFSFCSTLEELNINNFNTINVIDMSYMFSFC